MLPLQMELGGKDVCIVCEDADLVRAGVGIGRVGRWVMCVGVRGGGGAIVPRCTGLEGPRPFMPQGLPTTHG